MKSIFTIAKKSVLTAIWFGLAVVLCGTGRASAQCEQALSIVRARTVSTTHNRITVKFNRLLTDDERVAAGNPANWRVIHNEELERASDSSDPAVRAEALEKAFIKIDRIQRLVFDSLELVPKPETPLQPKQTYFIRFTNPVKPECPISPLLINLASSPPPSPVPTSNNDNGFALALTAAESRKDADIYIEGLAEGARKTKTTFSVDASFEKTLSADDDSIRLLTPFFNIKASSSPKADPDSMNFGVNYKGLKTYKGEGLKSILGTAGAKFEADTEFKNVNLVAQFRADFLFKKQIFKRTDIIPILGFEIGRNLKSPVEEAENKLIARPYFGAELYYVSFHNDKKLLTFQAQYVRRFPLKKEVYFEAEDDGSFRTVSFTRKPRDYVKAGLTFDFGKFYGFTLNYEYGQLPPLYKLVDSKFSVGLVFKAQVDRK